MKNKFVCKTLLVSIPSIILFFNLFAFAQTVGTGSTSSPACDLSPIDAGPLSLEGQDLSSQDRIFLNAKYVFKKGPSENINGSLKTSVVIKELLEVGFYRNWLLESISGLGTHIKDNLSASCSNSLGATGTEISSYTPVSFSVSQTVTRRKCTSTDLPCGLPETTCTGGSTGKLQTCDLPTCDWGGCRGGACHGGELPQAPVCRTTTKMCKAEQSVDLFSVTAKYGFQIGLSYSGKPPSQEIKTQAIQTSNNLDKSGGEITKLLFGIGLTNKLFENKIDDYKKGAQEYINKVLQQPLRSFNVPGADFLYLPEIRKNEDVKWVVPSKSPAGAAPFAISIARDSTLLTSAACRVISCLRESKKAGVLLVNSCSFS
jgi:hypothetical protein